MKKYVADRTVAGVLLIALAGGAAALLLWRLRKKKSMQEDTAAAATHLEHTSPKSRHSRWHKDAYTNATGSLGAASR